MDIDEIVHVCDTVGGNELFETGSKEDNGGIVKIDGVKSVSSSRLSNLYVSVPQHNMQ